MTALEDLAGTLGVSPDRLAMLASYDEAELRRFEQLVSGAMRQEDAAFDAGAEEGLRFVPALLRPAAKKMLFGGHRG
jgi:hypothetical protein